MYGYSLAGTTALNDAGMLHCSSIVAANYSIISYTYPPTGDNAGWAWPPPVMLTPQYMID
jgi:hypothetical protein